MKTQVRVLGIDDSPFSFSDKRVQVVGALVRIPNYLEGVTMTEIEVDGSDSIALESKFDDWQRRWRLIEKVETQRIETEHNPIHISHIGISIEDLRTVIKNSTVRGALPEPLRVAHLIASAIKTGESYGRA
jgi:endonuclease V-like protein UPF0215 family